MASRVSLDLVTYLCKNQEHFNINLILLSNSPYSSFANYPDNVLYKKMFFWSNSQSKVVIFLWFSSVCVCVLGGWGSVQFSCSVVSDSLRLHGLQHAGPPCPSPTPGVYSNSCPLSQWCHPTISSSVIPFSSRLQSFSTLGSFQMSQFFASGGQSAGVSASASVQTYISLEHFTSMVQYAEGDKDRSRKAD